MNDKRLGNVIEAALLAAGRPLSRTELAALFDEAERPDPERMDAALEVLAGEYAGRGIEITETASGFRVQVRGEYAAAVSRLWQERPPRYSRAFLETLALIAYRQPLTRGEIESIRGVALNTNIVKTLLERGWVRIVGHREVPGHPELLGTTREFLDYFGLKSLDELPTLSELKDLDNLGVQLEFPEADAGAEADGGGAASGGGDGSDPAHATGRGEVQELVAAGAGPATVGEPGAA